MANSIYGLPSDNLAASVTPTLVQGTADPAHPLANLYDGNKDTLFRRNSAAICEIQWDFVTPRTFGIVALHQITIDAGSAVKVYSTTAAYPGAPTGGETFSPVVAAAREDGLRYGPYVDLSALGAKRYIRILIPAQASVPCAIGEVTITGTKRSLIQNFETQLDYADRRLVIDQQSDTAAIRSFDWGVTTRRIGVTRWILHAAALAEFYTLLRSVKVRLTPFLFILDPAASPQDARLVRFATDPIVRQTHPGLWETSFLLDEVSGGVPV